MLRANRRKGATLGREALMCLVVICIFGVVRDVIRAGHDYP
jgi:hypothetical protein